MSRRTAETDTDNIKVALLAGGLGTRIMEETTVRPKPMVEIGGQPILRHIMGLYASQGFDSFVVALGYMGDVIREHFDTNRAPWQVDLVDTGKDTMTGGRLRASSRICRTGPSCSPTATASLTSTPGSCCASTAPTAVSPP